MSEASRMTTAKMIGQFLAVGLCGAVLASFLRIPAGLMIGPMLAMMFLKWVAPDTGKAPLAFGEIGKILLGTYVGATFNRALLAELGELLVPVIVSTLILIAASLLLAWLLARYTDLDMATALFSLTPGGMQEMVAVSGDSGADVAAVTILQFVRYVSVLMLVPALAHWFFS
jgi:membrane AbrB-like protein